MHSSDWPEQGFTLIEVVVALVVSALLLAIIMNGALDAKARGVQAERKQSAILLAGQLLDIRSLADFDAKPSVGRAGPLDWQVEEKAIEADPRGLFTLSEMSVTVRSEQSVILKQAATRKLKAKPLS